MKKSAAADASAGTLLDMPGVESHSVLIRLARGCWAHPEQAEDLASRCALLLEASPSDTYVVGTTAARLYGLWLPPIADEIHLATATPERLGKQMTRTRRPEIKSHRLQLPGQDRSVLRGLPLASLARVWRDLGSELRVPALVAAGDRALQLGATRGQLEEVSERLRRRPGARAAAAALPLLDQRSRSRPESHLRVAVSAADLPRFEVNIPIYRADGGWLAEPDLSLEEARIALEYQGSDHAELRRMRRDLTRATDLRAEGWLALLYGPAETFSRPEAIRAEVRRAIRARAPHLLRRVRAQRRAA